MKKIIILSIAILSSILLAGCDSSSNKTESEDKPEIKIDTNIKKTKYKKLICNMTKMGDTVTVSHSVIFDYDKDDIPTYFTMSSTYTIDKEYYSQMTNEEKEAEIERLKTITSNAYSKYSEYKTTQEINNKENVISGKLTSEDRKLLDDLGPIEELKEDLEDPNANNPYSCFIQDVEY